MKTIPKPIERLVESICDALHINNFIARNAVYEITVKELTQLIEAADELAADAGALDTDEMVRCGLEEDIAQYLAARNNLNPP